MKKRRGRNPTDHMPAGGAARSRAGPGAGRPPVPALPGKVTGRRALPWAALRLSIAQRPSERQAARRRRRNWPPRRAGTQLIEQAVKPFHTVASAFGVQVRFWKRLKSKAWIRFPGPQTGQRSTQQQARRGRRDRPPRQLVVWYDSRLEFRPRQRCGSHDTVNGHSKWCG